MTDMKRLAAIALLALLLVPHKAEAGYKYLNAEGEYLIELPDAPTGETIWAQRGDVPFLKNPPKYGSVGEYAYFRRVSPDTGDQFDVEIYFIKADHAFLQSLTEDDIKSALKARMASLHMRNEKLNVSVGTRTLKWGTYSGFSVSENNEVLYNIAHYMTGLDSITFVRCSYSVINKQYNQYYKTLASSITYLGR
jgi:hypothetical protein